MRALRIRGGGSMADRHSREGVSASDGLLRTGSTSVGTHAFFCGVHRTVDQRKRPRDHLGTSARPPRNFRETTPQLRQDHRRTSANLRGSLREPANTDFNRATSPAACLPAVSTGATSPVRAVTPPPTPTGRAPP